MKTQFQMWLAVNCDYLLKSGYIVRQDLYVIKPLLKMWGTDDLLVPYFGKAQEVSFDENLKRLLWN